MEVPNRSEQRSIKHRSISGLWTLPLSRSTTRSNFMSLKHSQRCRSGRTSGIRFARIKTGCSGPTSAGGSMRSLLTNSSMGQLWIQGTGKRAQPRPVWQ